MLQSLIIPESQHLIYIDVTKENYIDVTKEMGGGGRTHLLSRTATWTALRVSLGFPCALKPCWCPFFCVSNDVVLRI